MSDEVRREGVVGEDNEADRRELPGPRCFGTGAFAEGKESGRGGAGDSAKVRYDTSGPPLQFKGILIGAPFTCPTS